MYHGFDWYGRTLEVREVGVFLLASSICMTHQLFRRTDMLAFQALERSVVVSVVHLAVSEECAVDSEVASVVASMVAVVVVVPVAISPTRSSTQTIMALTRPALLVAAV